MKTIDIHISMQLADFDELSSEERQLVSEAIRATHNAYAPYSHFSVGAALRLADGSIVIGANQENAAFPSGLCAERSAIFAAQSQRPDQPVEALAIAARSAGQLVSEPVTPCGACRQVILEIEERYSQPVRILLYGTAGVYRIGSVRDLLPLSFVDANMR